MMLYNILSKSEKVHSDQLAVVYGEKRYSYAQFRERVDRLASGLLSVGVREKDRVAILHKNCRRFLETYFAAAKIGAVLVPLNYRLDSKDLVQMMNDSEACVLIADAGLISELANKKNALPFLRVVILTEPGTASLLQESYLNYETILENADSDEGLTKVPKGSEIAQIYYTSGTTGRPKGVILTNRNNWKHAGTATRELALSSSDRWLHVSPMFHLADAWSVWSITWAGAVHVMIPGFESRLVLETIETHKITISNFIPTMLNLLVNFPGVENYDFSSLRLILSGGAPMAKGVIKKITEIFGCDYVQTYGLTETSPFLTMSLLKEEMKSFPFEQRLKYMATTGRPFGNVSLRVVKESGAEVIPDGKDVGEIIVKEETITPGYWKLPEETSKRIVEGWLHTRDLAVVDPAGYVTIVDRKDDLIITGGENVFSIEVENVLSSHPGILEAAVIGLPDAVWGEKVTAVVVPKEGAGLNEEDVIRFCKVNMPHFKVPKRVIFTDQFPRVG
jgi:acyl-CoA synthetase (AMP-forming)/AMP-acid ligase II